MADAKTTQEGFEVWITNPAARTTQEGFEVWITGAVLTAARYTAFYCLSMLFLASWYLSEIRQ